MADFVIEKTEVVTNLHNSSINCVELSNDLVLTCCDEKLVAYNCVTKTREELFRAKKEEEISYLRCLNDAQLLAAVSQSICVVDMTSAKLIYECKQFRDCVNTFDTNKVGNCLASGDDSGEIKLFDLRASANSSEQLSLTKTLHGHDNICYAIKFNPANDKELFSGSFDCSALKWDLRFVKKSTKSKQPAYAKQVNMSEVMLNVAKHSQLKANKSLGEENDCLISTMTPCFVHSLHFTQRDNRLLCGLENGVCVALDPNTCDYVGHEQLQKLNCALNQFGSFNDGDNGDGNELTMASGNGASIDFVRIVDNVTSTSNDETVNEEKRPAKTMSKQNEALLKAFTPKISIQKVNDMSIEHKYKVNSFKYSNGRIFVADTSNNLTIYKLMKKAAK